MSRELEAWDAPEEIRARYAVDDVFEVDPDNWTAVLVFLRSSTQWVYSLTGHKTGLNYAGVAVVAAALGYELGAELLEDLQVMELETLNGMRAK